MSNSSEMCYNPYLLLVNEAISTVGQDLAHHSGTMTQQRPTYVTTTSLSFSLVPSGVLQTASWQHSSTQRIQLSAHSRRCKSSIELHRTKYYPMENDGLFFTNNLNQTWDSLDVDLRRKQQSLWVFTKWTKTEAEKIHKQKVGQLPKHTGKCSNHPLVCKPGCDEIKLSKTIGIFSFF